MAIFKAGQRVKWVALAHYSNPVPIGATGTVVEPWEYAMDGEVSVLLDPTCRDEIHRCGRVFAKPFQLAPLTDPKADEFIERIKKLKPYEEPKRQNGDIVRLPTELVRHKTGPWT